MQANQQAQQKDSEDVDLRNALLRRAYEGEIIGCAMYRGLIARRGKDHRRALELLYDIERLTADALAPLIGHYGVAVSEENATREGQQLGVSLFDQPWKSMWTEVSRLAADYLRDFNRLANALDEPHTAIGRQVVEHEEALIDFARREIADDPDSLAPLYDYLNRYRATLTSETSAD